MNYIDMIEKIAAEYPQNDDLTGALMMSGHRINKYKKSPFMYKDNIFQDMDYQRKSPEKLKQKANKELDYELLLKSRGHGNEGHTAFVNGIPYQAHDLKYIRSHIQDPVRKSKKIEDLPEYDKRVGSRINKYLSRQTDLYAKIGAGAGAGLGALYGYVRHGRTSKDAPLSKKILKGSIGALRGAALPGIPLSLAGMMAGAFKDVERGPKLKSKIYESMTPEEKRILFRERNRIFDEHLKGKLDKERDEITIEELS